MKKKKIFISYDYDNDRDYKNLLVAWKENKKMKDFKFIDKSTDISINSKNENYIKKCIKDDIKSANVVLCIVGEKTNKNKWIDFEIKEAKIQQKNIIAVKTDKDCKLPESIKKYADSVINSYEMKKIAQAIEGTREFSPNSIEIPLLRIKC